MVLSKQIEEIIMERKYLGRNDSTQKVLIAQNVKQALLLETKGINVRQVDALIANGVDENQMIKLVFCPKNTKWTRAMCMGVPKSKTEFDIVGYEFLEQLEKM